MGQTRTATRSILLSDDSSRLLLQARSIMRASAPSSMAVDEDAVVGRSTTTTTKTVPPRKKAPHAQRLQETAFRCPFCNRHGSVECRIDHKGRTAEVSCWTCQASYSTAAHALTEPVDVYGEWIDDCQLGDCDGDIAMVA